MKDIRISIRLSDEEHKALKIIAIKKNTSMQELLIGYIKSKIKREQQNEK